MIRPEDVTDAMVEVLHEKYDIAGRIGTPTKVAARIAIAAAINASGCVLVPREMLENVSEALRCYGHAMVEHFALAPALVNVGNLRAGVKAMLAADPREQALERMAEDAQGLGLYGKEKSDE